MTEGEEDGLVGRVRDQLDYCDRTQAREAALDREDLRAILETLTRTPTATPSDEVVRLRDALGLARNRLQAAAINEAPKQSREYYDYSQWADEASAALSAIEGEKT